MLKEEIKKLTLENKRLQQFASQPPSGNSTPSLTPIQSFNNKQSHRLTPPPYSANTFLPSLYSPSPSGSPSPSFPSSPHSLTGTQSPPRNSPYLSPIGSPSRNSNSPLMQMYQQNQQQMQLVISFSFAFIIYYSIYIF